jgi:hypothetical protein
VDYGGDSELGIPASNDTYKGFSATSGFDLMWDLEGSGDKVDPKSFSINDVSGGAVDLERDGTTESLVILLSDTSGILIYDYFAQVDTATAR